MIVLLVGPSGVGKTAAYRKIEDEGTFLNCIFRHLDGLATKWGVVQGWLEKESVSLLRQHLNDDQLFLAFGLESIGDLAGRNPDKHLVVDVGAGFQDARSARYLSRIHKTIAITGKPKNVFQRIRKNRGDKRTFSDYRAMEFSSHRMKIYENCHHKIDTTRQTLDETAAELSEVLAKLLSSGDT